MSAKPAAVAPRIWAKFTPAQRKAWRTIFKAIAYEWGISERKLSKAERSVIASNHATLAVWALVG